jgi:hypothetical protein
MSFYPVCCFLSFSPDMFLSTLVSIMRPDVLTSNSPEGHEKAQNFQSIELVSGRGQKGLPPKYDIWYDIYYLQLGYHPVAVVRTL